MFDQITPFEAQPWIVAAGEMIADAPAVGETMGYAMTNHDTGEVYQLTGEDVAEIGHAMLREAMYCIKHLNACFELEVA